MTDPPICPVCGRPCPPNEFTAYHSHEDCHEWKYAPSSGPCSTSADHSSPLGCRGDRRRLKTIPAEF